jgi:hypothetical protein
VFHLFIWLLNRLAAIAAAHATPLGLWPLIRCFRMADGLNTITRRGEIASSAAVFGVRPIRRPFLRFLVMALFPCRVRIPDRREMRITA